MKSENINEIKKEDKGAIKKFTIIMIIAMIFGFFVGILSVSMGENLADVSVRLIRNVLAFIAPSANAFLIPVAFIPTIYLYQISRRRYKEWDGEDEELLEKIGINLSYAQWISYLALIISFFFFAVGIWQITNLQFSVSSVFIALWLGSFLLIGLFVVLAQQKIVNFTKEINPEKEGSVFEHDFTKKWEQSCDEAEKLMIYKSGYKAYKTGSITCTVMCTILITGSIVWDFGLLPIAFVTIIWIVLTTSYCFESIRLDKVKNNK